MNFKEEKHGYNKTEVDFYVSDLEIKLSNAQKEVERLTNQINEISRGQKDFQEKSKNISVALTAAVEKARQIEESSKNVYKLKIQQINLLYNRWEGFLEEMLKKYPKVETVNSVKQMMSEFRNSIKSTLKDDFKIGGSVNVNSDSDPIRVLLSRMNEHLKKAPEINQKTATIERKKLSSDMLHKQTDLERMEEKAPIIKPIYEKQMGTKYENLVDQFLRDDPVEDNYAKTIIKEAYPNVNDSGFDLKEAVNPKQDLTEIMKAFDFYNDYDDSEK